VKESEERQVNDALKQIRFTNLNNIQLSGKTVLFFWNNTIPSILNEIEVVIRFAMKNPSIKIVLINTENINEPQVESVLRQVTDKFSLTQNIYFVHDPQGSLSKYLTTGKVDTSKSQSSFTENGAVKRCLNINVALWRNAAKIFEQFR
jgi:thiol-disulfide isomerase/thioredoxin